MFDIAMNGSKHLVLDRRKFLSVAAGLVAAGVIPKSALALAAPYAFKQGAYDVTVVSDGTLTLPLSVVSPEAKPEDLKALLGAMMQGEQAQFEASLQIGKRCDPHGHRFRRQLCPHGGQARRKSQGGGRRCRRHHQGDLHPRPPRSLLGNPRRRWQAHLHQRLIPLGRNRMEFLVAPDLAGKMPKDMEGMVKTTQGQLAGIKDKVTMFKPGAEVLPGINVIDTAGHTPGHVSFELAGGDGLIITADAITNPLVFFPHPDWKFGFDSDHDTAIANRKKLLHMASTGKKKLLGYHWPYPGIGMAEAKDGAYVYVPVS